MEPYDQTNKQWVLIKRGSAEPHRYLPTNQINKNYGHKQNRHPNPDPDRDPDDGIDQRAYELYQQ